MSCAPRDDTIIKEQIIDSLCVSALLVELEKCMYLTWDHIRLTMARLIYNDKEQTKNETNHS